MNRCATLVDNCNSLLSKIPEDIVSLFSRLAIATVFWRSVQTKITGWKIFGQSFNVTNISQSTFLLFQYEYNLPFLDPEIAAYLGTFAEFLLPILLVLGLATRFAALGLLAVTAVIQFLVLPEGWPTHILWAALLIYLVKHGGGRIAVDGLISRRR